MKRSGQFMTWCTLFIRYVYIWGKPTSCSDFLISEVIWYHGHVKCDSILE